MAMTTAYPRERIERAARLYATVGDAARALGCAPGSFTRLCQRWGVETPTQRRARAAQPAS